MENTIREIFTEKEWEGLTELEPTVCYQVEKYPLDLEVDWERIGESHE